MNIHPTDVEAAVAKAYEVSDHYDLTHLTGGDPHRYMDRLLESCTAVGVGRFQIIEVNVAYEGSAVYSACVMNTDGSADIVLARGLDLPWRRYLVCKELFHIMIDKEEYRNMDLAAHTASVAVDFQLDDSQPEPAVAAEFLAEVAAMEFLFPYARRESLLKAFPQPDFASVSAQYDLPSVLVERYLSDLRMAPLAEFCRRHKG